MECHVFGHSAAQCLKKPLPQRTEWVVKGSQIVEQATDEGAAGQSAGVVLPSKGNSPIGSVGVSAILDLGKLCLLRIIVLMLLVQFKLAPVLLAPLLG